MYRMVLRDTRLKPTILCDHCERPIFDASMANIEWTLDDDGLPLDGVIYHVHATCDHPFRMAQGLDHVWAWERLDAHLLEVRHNTHRDLQQALDQVELLASMS